MFKLRVSVSNICFVSENEIAYATPQSEGVLKAYRNSAVSAALESHPQLKEDQGASVLHFPPDSSRLMIATIGARVAVIDLPETKDEPATVLRVFSQHRSGKSSSGRAIAGEKGQGKQSNGDAMSADEDSSEDSETDGEDDNVESNISTIACAATSVDGQWLVTADLSRRMHVFNLDILQHHSPLPSLPAPAAALAFSSLNPSLLAIGAVDNTIAFLDVDTRTVPNWAYRLAQGFNTAMKQERDTITGISFDPKAIKTDTIMVHGPSWHINGRMNGLAITTAMAEQRSKRKLVDSAEEEDASTDIRHSNVKSEIHVAPFVSRKFGSILLFDFASDGELVLVERPYFDLLAGMAPAYAERRYGTL
jgi:U3 small nucleolar RNA-associated protein 4